jgi:anti-sigma factor ChrR (cupin superfamily)
MKAFVNLYDDLNWQDAIEYPAGTKLKVLRNEETAKTVLLKLPAGFSMGIHSHVTAEQHFILQGEYTSEGELYRTGSYQIFASHEEHGPFESENGALVLVVWDPVRTD